MGITGLVGGYTTIYGGDANRVHNVQLVANLIDHTLIRPGQVFSFNGTTGERNADKGFLEAPVIINGELQTGLGGGVCQVSTTVFNAAYEAGLDITERTNHALYISHYPQGRDATVNYPDLDLKFVNDTERWLLLRTFVGSSSLTVNLYGAPQNRRVESEVGAAGGRRASRRRPGGRTRRSRRAGASSPTRARRRSRRASAGRSTTRAARCSTRTCGTRPTAARRRSSSSARSRSRRAEAEGGGEAGGRRRGAARRRAARRRSIRAPARTQLSASATASASQAGNRAGRSVFASTTACLVQPSATSSPSHVTAYS